MYIYACIYRHTYATKNHLDCSEINTLKKTVPLTKTVYMVIVLFP